MRPPRIILAILLSLIFLGACTIAALPAQPSDTAVQTTLPNLTGTWNVEAFGSVMAKSDALGKWTHHKDYNSHITAQAVINDQQGRVLHGVFMAPLGENESFIAVIGMDNSSLYLADQDGLNDLRIIDANLMEGVYRQVTANDTVAAYSTWTRTK